MNIFFRTEEDCLRQSTTSLLRTLSVPKDNEHVVSLMKTLKVLEMFLMIWITPIVVSGLFSSKVSACSMLIKNSAEARLGGMIEQSLLKQT